MLISTITQIKEASTPEELISRFTNVLFKRRGRHSWTCCPLHGENTPSLMMDDHGRLHCFGCGWNGDSLDFVAATNAWTLGETIKRVADDLGVKKAQTDEERRTLRKLVARRRRERAEREQSDFERQAQIVKLIREFRFLGRWLADQREPTDDVWTVVHRRNAIEEELADLDAEKEAAMHGNHGSGLARGESTTAS